MALLAFNKLLLVIGFVFLIHAAYSAAQRKYQRVIVFVNKFTWYNEEHSPNYTQNCRPHVFEDNRTGINFPTVRCKLKYLSNERIEIKIVSIFLQILLQAITSLFLIIYSLLAVVGDFKEIRAAVDLQGKSWETLSNIPSFYTFNHRGKALSPAYAELSTVGKASLDSDD